MSEPCDGRTDGRKYIRTRVKLYAPPHFVAEGGLGEIKTRLCHEVFLVTICAYPVARQRKNTMIRTAAVAQSGPFKVPFLYLNPLYIFEFIGSTEVSLRYCLHVKCVFQENMCTTN